MDKAFIQTVSRHKPYLTRRRTFRIDKFYIAALKDCQRKFVVQKSEVVMVGWLALNVHFQHKYGYIRDDQVVMAVVN